jgi:DNA-binding response OmpR family regulator
MAELTKKFTIMIVDDEALVARSISRFFRGEQFDCVIVNNPQEVIDSYKKSHPNLVIMDLQMPDKSGFDLLKEIREFDRMTPVIMVSGNMDNDKIEALKKMGATECFEKPLSPLKILETVNRYLTEN